MSAHDNQVCPGFAGYLEYEPGCVSFFKPVLDTHVLIGCLDLVELMAWYAVVFFRTLSRLELLVPERRRYYVEDDDACAAIPCQRTGQGKGLLRVFREVSRKHYGVDR